MTTSTDFNQSIARFRQLEQPLRSHIAPVPDTLGGNDIVIRTSLMDIVNGFLRRVHSPSGNADIVTDTTLRQAATPPRLLNSLLAAANEALYRSTTINLDDDDEGEPIIETDATQGDEDDDGW
jgi:hypothetical protein